MCRSTIHKKEKNQKTSTFISPYSYGSPGDSSSASSYSSASNTPEPEAYVRQEEIEIKIPVKTTPVVPKKQYQCHLCFKNFSRPSALQTHSYTHTAEKPFQCLSPGCGRRFSVVSNLRRHFKVHQKPTVSDKISSEDRLRYVRQLIKSSNAVLAKQKETYDGQNQQHQEDRLPTNTNTYQTLGVHPTTTATIPETHFNKNYCGDEQQRNEPKNIYSQITSSCSSRYHHYILLPAINNHNNNNIPMPVTHGGFASEANNYIPGINNGENYLADTAISGYYHHQQPHRLLSTKDSMIPSKAALPPAIHSLPQQQYSNQISSYFSYVDERNDDYNELSINYSP